MRNERETSKKTRNLASLHSIPSGIWSLGIVSMFMDISSEIIHSLLPVFMSTVLGVNMITIGLVEGIAEATASITKVFSGVLSDYFRKRKLLLVIGYGLAAITKPLFPLAASIHWVFAARFIDRIGKGIRGAPRDALVADITPPAMRGAAYGLRQTLDTVGAFLGPLFAIGLMVLFANQIKAVLWVAVIPAFIAVTCLIIGVHEPKQHSTTKSKSRKLLTITGARQLPSRYWFIVLLGAVFTMARFSEAFLVLRAQSIGLSIGYVPMVMIFMNISYSAAAYPAGMAADRFSKRLLLVAGLTLLILSDFLLAKATLPWHVMGGALLWGLHMAATQGLFAKLVADTTTAELRGTAFGVFNLASGVALLVASVMAGYLWDAIGPSATFTAGAAFATFAAIGIIFFRPKRV